MEDAESQSTGSLVTIIPESWFHPSYLWVLSASFPTVWDTNETGIQVSVALYLQMCISGKLQVTNNAMGSH